MTDDNGAPRETVTLRMIVERVGGRYAGPDAHLDETITGLAPLHEATRDRVSWLADEKHVERLAGCEALAIIGAEASVGSHERGLVCADPQMAVAQVLELFDRPPCEPAVGVHPTAVVDGSVQLGRGARIGAHVVLKRGAVIGERTVIHPGVSVGAEAVVGSDCVLFDRCTIYDRCRIGDRVRIHASAVIGADGFGYIFREGRHHKLPHLGDVVIEDDVEIGANTCIDRGKTGSTRIGRGTKIDDLVMIAHNVEIGPLCIITALCGIAGSSKLGAGVVMGGQVGVSDNLTIEDGARIGGGSAVIGNLSGGGDYYGSPARDARKTKRSLAAVLRLPKLMERIKAMESRLKRLEGSEGAPKGEA